MDPLLTAGLVAGGVALAGVAVFAAWRLTRRAPEAPVEMELVIEDERPVSFVPPSRMPAPVAAAPPPPSSPRAHPERAPAMVLTQGVAMRDDAFSRRAPVAPARREPFKEPPPMKSWAQQVKDTTGPEVPTEWARRQVGPVESGRVAGACGGCGARLSVSDTRPLRIACPVCGRTKLVA